MKKIFLVTIALCLTIGLLGTVYVDGSNTQGPWYGTIAYPWQYIQQGIEQALTLTGDVYIEVLNNETPSQYMENLTIDFTESSTELLEIILYNENENPDLCTIRGNGQDNVIRLGPLLAFDTMRHVTIKGFTIENSGTENEDAGIAATISTTIQNNEIRYCMQAIRINWTGCWAYGNINILDNEIYDNSSSLTHTNVIHLYKAFDVNIINNHIYENDGPAIFNGDTVNSTIVGNLIEDNYNGINLSRVWYQNYDSEYKIESNDILNNNQYGINQVSSTGAYSLLSIIVQNNYILDHDYGIMLNNSNDILINNNFVSHNNSAVLLSDEVKMDFENNTIADNDYEINSTTSDVSFGHFKNNIFWHNTNQDIIFYQIPISPIGEINYNCIQDLLILPTFITIGTGNIDDDPIFNPDYTLFYESEENKSPCIDTADPDTDGDGIEWQYDEDDRDFDGSRMDMGCYPYLHDYDTIVFTEGVHWVSFPVLTEQGVYTVSPIHPSIPPINNQIFQQAYYEDDNGGLLQLEPTSTGTIDGFSKIEGKRYYTPMSIEPEGTEYEDNDVNFNNMLFRHEGYKITVGEVVEPTVLTVGGSNDERLPEDHVIAGDMPYGEYHWIGYWLQESQNIVDAFGGNSTNPADNLWQYVEKVKAEDWYYDRCSIVRGIVEPIPISWITTGKTMEYGKMYMVWFLDETVENFKWYVSGFSEEPEMETESENFFYTEKPDYEVIDVLDIPEDVVEIGVFQENECVGAVVVQDSCEQILVYSENANREEIPFSFERVTGNRGLNQPIINYLVFNEDSGEFEKGNVISGRQESSIIKFGDIGEPQNETPVVNAVALHNNYPNPFNPETNISFSIPAEQKVRLTIYNLKGQKVRELVNGQFVSGTHSVVWNGKDDNGKSVGSGVYLYKLKTSDKVISKKMLLLK